MITIKKNIAVTGKYEKPIVTDVFYKKNKRNKPIVIFCHGYKGFKDWGAWDIVAKHFAASDFFFIKFNFSHNGGTLELPIDFPDLEAFGNNNYIKELDDLQSIIDWSISNEEFHEELDHNEIILIGHSRGGGIVSLKAAEEHKVTQVISWAGVSDYASRFPVGEAFQQWKKEGVMYIKNGRTLQDMPHYFQFYTKFIENKERLTIARAVQQLLKPHLIIHGEEDTVVQLEEAKRLHKWNPKSKLELISNGDHVFGAKHPWNKIELPEQLDETVKKTIIFIRNTTKK